MPTGVVGNSQGSSEANAARPSRASMNRKILFAGHLRRSLPQRVFIHKRDTGCLRRPGRLAVEASH